MLDLVRNCCRSVVRSSIEESEPLSVVEPAPMSAARARQHLSELSDVPVTVARCPTVLLADLDSPFLVAVRLADVAVVPLKLVVIFLVVPLVPVLVRVRPLRLEAVPIVLFEPIVTLSLVTADTSVLPP